MANLTLPPLDAPDWGDIGGGLLKWDTKTGTGVAVKAGQKVKVHYTGWTTDGKIFNSSVQRGEPIEFPLTGVIKGWQDGIPGMQVGGVRRLSIPGPMAYGARGIPGTIPPNATLVFEVELLQIK